ncbi:hypothetical protein J7443_17585 [Tropicibacter sp. R15_0]|uniref:head-tail joining protein n=1 Tax=Tropicibacter sp. R15_0 TaxID=2821101 RepID=UPI001ADC4E25|nr:hypothetical protein [Tropicibacter sp. R15_0]MBO9467060.1 hypothetical protein [Tropicibacter sp. R15_0]
MGIEGADDWAVFTDPDVFGENVIFTGQGADPLTISAIFTTPGAVVASGFQAGVATTEPMLTLGVAQLPFTPAQHDQVQLTVGHPGFPAGTALRVADVQPDGSGMIRLILERM